MARGWIESHWHTDQLCLSGSGTKTGLICWMWLSNGTQSMDWLLCGGKEDWEECLYKHSSGLVPLSVPAVVEIHWLFGHGAEAKNQWCIQYSFVGFFSQCGKCHWHELLFPGKAEWHKPRQMSKKRFSPHMTCESTFYQTYSESSHVTERSISRESCLVWWWETEGH